MRDADDPTLEGWLTEEQLLAAAAAAGHPVSKSQLKRWRGNDLIPRPQQSWHAGRRGSTSLYPPGTLEQLCALEEFHQTIKPLPALGFELWWQGFPVLPSKARGWIAQIIEKNTRVDAIREARNDAYDVADEITEALGSAELRDPLLRFLNRRVGRDQAAQGAAFYALLLILLGTTPEWKSYGAEAEAPDAGELAPEDALARLTGFTRAAHDTAPDGTPLIDDPKVVKDIFARLGKRGALDISEMPRWIEKATDADLARARDDARMFTGPFPELLHGVEEVYGRDFAGLGLFTLPKDPSALRYWRASVVWMMVVVRKVVDDERLDEAEEYIQSHFQHTD